MNLPWVLIAITLGMFVFGLVLVPGIVFLAAPSLGTSGRTVLARILFTVSALSAEGTVLYQRASGIYDFLPVVRRDGELVAYDDTEEEFVDADTDVGWSRLGKRPFGVAWEKTEDAFEGTLFDPQSTDAEPIADGGQETVSLLGKRGGMPIATDAKPDDGFVVDVMQIMKRLEGAATGYAAVEAERSALKEFGGDQSDLQMKWMMLGVLGALISGAVMAYVVMGGL